MSKPEIGSKWNCVEQYGSVEAGEEITVTGFHGRGPDGTVFVDFTSRRGAGSMYLSRLDGRQFVPLSPAPAEPAKAAGWTPKVGERVMASGKVTTEEDARGWVHVVWIGGGGQLVHNISLRPEAAPGDTIPAPAPPTGAEILSESRQHRMRIADLEGDLAEEKAAKAALASQVAALTGDVALARRERDGWRAKWLRREGR